MRSIFIFSFLIILNLTCYSQSIRVKSTHYAKVNVNHVIEDYQVSFQKLEPSNHGIENSSSLLKKYSPKTSNKKAINHPSLMRNFEGNAYNSRVPNDNDIAISNNGDIVSVINSTIYFYDSDGQKQKNLSLGAFSSSLNILGSKYDPRVIYDQENDRFIVIYLSGNTDSTSNIIVGFSVSNNPLEDWNLYSLNGNPLNDGSWSDYPNVAISKNELFITINTFLNQSENASGFVESTIWQINKFNGYNGDSVLQTEYYHNLGLTNRTKFTIIPLQGGDHLYGPNMYFVMNQSKSDDASDIFKIIEITDTIGSLNKTLVIDSVKSNLSYNKPFNAKQPLKHELRTNDARLQNGYIQNDKAHFVFNCNVEESNLCGVYHGIIDLKNKSAIGYILSHPYKEWAFPAIAFAGKNSGDDEAIIVLNFCSDTIFAGTSSVYYKDGEHSDEKIIKNGESELNIIGDLADRWGDYSGIQRKYNEPGKVWVASCFANKIGSGSFANKLYGTWIAELGNPQYYQSIDDRFSITKNTEVYPNPSFQDFSLQFDSKSHQQIIVTLISNDGKRIELLRRSIQPGKQQFSFSTATLAQGIYLLEVKGSKELYLNQKVVVSTAE